MLRLKVYPTYYENFDMLKLEITKINFSGNIWKSVLTKIVDEFLYGILALSDNVFVNLTNPFIDIDEININGIKEYYLFSLKTINIKSESNINHFENLVNIQLEMMNVESMISEQTFNYPGIDSLLLNNDIDQNNLFTNNSNKIIIPSHKIQYEGKTYPYYGVMIGDIEKLTNVTPFRCPNIKDDNICLGNNPRTYNYIHLLECSNLDSAYFQDVLGDEWFEFVKACHRLQAMKIIKKLGG